MADATPWRGEDERPVVAGSASASADAVIWSLVLAAGIVVAGAVIYALRRWFFSSKASSPEATFLLQHLRELHAEGQITEAEFEKLKAQMIESASAMPPRKDGEARDRSRSFDR